MELPSSTGTLHYVAANMEYPFGFEARIRFSYRAKLRLQNILNQLCKDESLLLTAMFSDISHDDCAYTCPSRVV